MAKRRKEHRFGELEAARRRFGWSYTRLAQLSEFTLQHVLNILQGKGGSVAAVNHMADLLAVPRERVWPSADQIEKTQHEETAMKQQGRVTA